MLQKRKSTVASAANIMVQFQYKLETLKSTLDEIEKPEKLSAVKLTLKNLQNFATQITESLEREPNPAVEEEFVKYSEEYRVLKAEAEEKINKIEGVAANDEGEVDQEQQEQAPDVLSQEEAQISQDQKELDFLTEQTSQILQDQQNLNDLTKAVAEKIDEQHETILHVDDTIADAHEEMVEGNEDLEVAQEHQKGSTKCLLWIAAAVTIVVIILIIVLCVTLT